MLYYRKLDNVLNNKKNVPKSKCVFWQKCRQIAEVNFMKGKFEARFEIIFILCHRHASFSVKQTVFRNFSWNRNYKFSPISLNIRTNYIIGFLPNFQEHRRNKNGSSRNQKNYVGNHEVIFREFFNNSKTFRNSTPSNGKNWTSIRNIDESDLYVNASEELWRHLWFSTKMSVCSIISHLVWIHAHFSRKS